MSFSAPVRRSMSKSCCVTAQRCCRPLKRRNGSFLLTRCLRRSEASLTARRWRKGGCAKSADKFYCPSWSANASNRACVERCEIWRKPCRLSLVSRRLVQIKALPASPRQRMDPALHALLGVFDVFCRKPVFRLHFINRIDWAQEVALVAKWYCGIDAHAAFELRIRRGPLPLA